MYQQYQQLVTRSKGVSGSDALSVALRDLQNHIGVGTSVLDQLMNASMTRVKEELSGLTEIGKYYKALFEQVGQAAQTSGENPVLDAAYVSLRVAKIMLACQSCLSASTALTPIDLTSLISWLTDHHAAAMLPDGFFDCCASISNLACQDRII